MRLLDGTGKTTAVVRTILVATDFSDGAGLALRQAFELAARHDAHVTLVHVAPRGISREMLGTARQSLDDLVEGAPVPTDTRLITGAAGREIAYEAERRAADLVVVGAHGAHWLWDAFLGSTAETVVGLCRVPVLLVKFPAAHDYETVLLAVDASRTAFRAAQSGMSMTPAARHIVAHAVNILGENLMRLNGADDAAIDELRRGQISVVQPDIAQLTSELTPVPDDVILEPGRPEELVSRLPDHYEADLLVLGANRGAGVRRALLGSVSRHAVQRAPCDVLVVPLR